jgi:hypothetical protein
MSGGPPAGKGAAGWKFSGDFSVRSGDRDGKGTKNGKKFKGRAQFTFHFS